ncbi:MAG: CHASE2 domain-containing protein [Bryobacterales bacterium]|nr:CHASE2 domain-containing protein [Bryobacterales bacterium]
MKRRDAEYVGLLGGALIVALVASWTALGVQIDNNAYDWFFRLHEPAPWEPQSVVLAIDEASLRESGGMARLRESLAEALELVANAQPRAVAVDVVLADPGTPGADARLAAALRATPRAVLAADLLPDGSGWEEPVTLFREAAAGVGHVHAEPDPVSREILLEKANGRVRLWALALEAFRAAEGPPVVESPADLQIGGAVIPAARSAHRALRIRYRPPPDPVPQVSLSELRADPRLAARLTGKAVFLGVTAQTAARDRLQTPYTYATGRSMPGVEIHANVFETIAGRQFLLTAPAWMQLGVPVLLVALVGAIFGRMAGWPAYLLGGGVLAMAHIIPYFCFKQNFVLPVTGLVSAAWLSTAAAASYQHFVVRRRMLKAEGDRARYQQAMHFVVHEMRTPLTAIQGSSELMGRYQLPEPKRKEIAHLINSESKRLGKMIEIFLNVERLSAGQLELKREAFDSQELMDSCVARVRPLAERKEIGIVLRPAPGAMELVGDRELMEYAFYNLLTNAVKYSPPRTEVSVYFEAAAGRLRISVQDQGFGMDAKEVRQIFQKFYRTRKAEESGEAGTGIGLSIVEQIVAQHGGTIEVASSPGRGSCFTLVLPANTVLAGAS